METFLQWQKYHQCGEFRFRKPNPQANLICNLKFYQNRLKISKLICHFLSIRIVQKLKAAIKRSPVTALLGPRQCGKTNLARGLGEHRV